jgi:hypothetical protein
MALEVAEPSFRLWGARTPFTCSRSPSRVSAAEMRVHQTLGLTSRLKINPTSMNEIPYINYRALIDHLACKPPG